MCEQVEPLTVTSWLNRELKQKTWAKILPHSVFEVISHHQSKRMTDWALQEDNAGQLFDDEYENKPLK